MANTETEEKPMMIVGIDDSDHSFYALEWTLDHFLVPSSPNTPFKLIVVHSKPSPTSAIGFAGPGAADVYPFVDSDLKKIAARVAEKAKELCHSKSGCRLVEVLIKIHSFPPRTQSKSEK
ncbi:putative rossmann-like alpha/beta/alpha sandwich protein [Helianthus annuus]|nr:putative rossmann-like alpha/beta/alpha sandwich protein [Helianthus annuus]